MDRWDTRREDGAGSSRRTKPHESRCRRVTSKNTEPRETTNRVSQGSRRNLGGDRDNYSFTLELPQDENLEQILYGEVVDGSLTVSVRPPYATRTTKWSSQIPTFSQMMKTGKRLHLTVDHLTHIANMFGPRFKAEVSKDSVYNEDLSKHDQPDLQETVAVLETALRLIEKEGGEWPETSIPNVKVKNMIDECRETLNGLKTAELDRDWRRDVSIRFKSIESEFMWLVNRYAESIMWVAASDDEFARTLSQRESIWFKRLDPNMTNGFKYACTHPDSVRALSN